MKFTNTDCVRNMLFWHLIWELELGDQVNWQVEGNLAEYVERAGMGPMETWQQRIIIHQEIER
jgi:hypothetical protein